MFPLSPARTRREPSQWRGLVWTLVRTDFKTRYHGTIGGFVWALLKPLTMFLVLLAVFSYVFASEPQYKLDLIIGLFLYEFFQESTKIGPAVASRQGLSAHQGAVPVAGCWSSHVGVECGDHARAVLGRAGLVPGAHRTGAVGRDRVAPVRRLSGALLRDRRRLLARRERAVHAVSRSEPGVGGGHPGRVLRGADHLSARSPARSGCTSYLYLWPPTPIILFSRSVLVDGHAPSALAHVLLTAETCRHPCGGSAGLSLARAARRRGALMRRVVLEVTRRVEELRDSVRAPRHRPRARARSLPAARQTERLHVLRRRQFRAAARRKPRPDGTQRLRQEHAAEDRRPASTPPMPAR